MAALLIHIKSKMLLPRGDEAEEQGEDPRSELVERLLEYQRFKAVAESFAELDMVRMHVWSRPPGRAPRPTPVEVDMSEVVALRPDRRVPPGARPLQARSPARRSS